MPVGVTADIEGVDPREKILIGGKSGIYVLDRRGEKWELLKRFYDSAEKDERLRSNDGAVDPHGRFWVGTMNDFWVGEPQAEGKWVLYDVGVLSFLVLASFLGFARFSQSSETPTLPKHPFYPSSITCESNSRLYPPRSIYAHTQTHLKPQ